MSEGVSVYDFVQQVYYAQEKVVLDFLPYDDKYKEILLEGNLVAKDFQKDEDWSFFRERLILGDTDDRGDGWIPEYRLPEWVYKPSTLHDDSVRLYKRARHKCKGPRSCHGCNSGNCIEEYDFVVAPWSSKGVQRHHRNMVGQWPYNGVPDHTLKAINLGLDVTFNRLLLPYECNRIAVTDVQRRIELFELCPYTSKAKCEEEVSDCRSCKYATRIMYTDIPDPNYFIIKTAAKHGEGSPPAQGRIVGLNDDAQKILSAMRENDAAATCSDSVEWAPLNFIRIF